MCLVKLKLCFWPASLLATVLACGNVLAQTGAPPDRVSPAAAHSPARVYVIPIHGMIERGLLYAFRRGMEEAAANGADAVILDMDTPGGKLDSAEEMVLLLLQARMRTYTFVNPRAYSAGAIIALATDAIYMTPTGLIGDAMPIMMSPIPFGGAQAVPEDLKAKIMSPTVALVRSAAQAKGYDPELAEAMVRPEFEYKIGDRVICPAGQLLTLTATDAAEPLRAGGKPLLSSGTIADLDELLTKVGLASAAVTVVSITPSEKVARAIEGFPLSSILLALGLLGLYIEFKMPGVLAPGIAGVLCLALWFWGHHIAGLSNFADLLLFATGIVLLVVEIFVLPGFGYAGVVGLLMVVASILLSMVSFAPAPPIDIPLTYPALSLQRGVTNLALAVLMVAVAAILLARILPRTVLFNKLVLDTSLNNATQSAAAATSNPYVGRHGVAITPLHPAGIGEFEGLRLNVVARGAFLDQGTPIVIAEAHGNRIIVDALTTDSAAA